MGRPIQLGQVTAYLEANRAVMAGKGVNRRTHEGVDFANMTEEALRERLTEEHASKAFIEAELALLRTYRARIDTEQVRDAKKRLAEKRTATAQEELGDYFDARNRMKKRVQGRKESENAT